LYTSLLRVHRKKCSLHPADSLFGLAGKTVFLAFLYSSIVAVNTLPLCCTIFQMLLKEKKIVSHFYSLAIRFPGRHQGSEGAIVSKEHETEKKSTFSISSLLWFRRLSLERLKMTFQLKIGQRENRRFQVPNSGQW
jgi:hypothetical protein